MEDASSEGCLLVTGMIRWAAALVLAGAIVGSLGAAKADAQKCVPTCRDGYVCHKGECILACNPPCAEGEVCVSDGQCVAAEAPAAAPAYAATPQYDTRVDSKKPSIAIPATFMGVGGFLLVAGGVTFATEDFDDFGFWDTGHYVGVGLMTMGLVTLAIATPFLARQIRARKRWKEQRVGEIGRNLAIAPVIAPVPKGQYGLALRGTF